jgi:hypothetical protein
LRTSLRYLPRMSRIRHKQRVRFAAYMARRFYKETCDECKRQGVRYHGHAHDIRQVCAAAVVVFVKGVTAEEIVDVMTRPSNRQDLGDDAMELELGPIKWKLHPKFVAKSEP